MIYSHHRGFVALMSVIIISAILLVLVFTLGTSAFFNRFDALDVESKRVSQGLAEACVNAALLKYVRGDYTGGTVAVAQKTCTICQITPSGIIQTRAVENGAYTNIKVVTIPSTAGGLVIASWSELPNAPAGCTLP